MSGVDGVSDWVIRDAVPEDESCLVPMWLHGYATSKEVQETGLTAARERGGDHQVQFWRVHQPIVMALLRRSTIRVACAVGRSDYSNGPAVILGWVCTSPGFVHWVSIKRKVAQMEGGAVARELVSELLGSHVDDELLMTFDLVDLRKLGKLPETWRRDRSIVGALRNLSTKRDPFFRGLAEDVLHAEAWKPNSERAA